MGSGTARITEAQFIYLGLKKDKWPCITLEQVQAYLAEPEMLDNEEDYNSDFLERFWFYHGWYWNEV